MLINYYDQISVFIMPLLSELLIKYDLQENKTVLDLIISNLETIK